MFIAIPPGETLTYSRILQVRGFLAKAGSGAAPKGNTTGSVGSASFDADLDPPCRHLRIFLLLGRSRRGAEARFPTPPAKPCMPLSRHTALPLSVILSLDPLRLRRFCISPMSIGTFPYVLNRLPLHRHSRQTAALRSPRLSPGSSLLWRHRLPSKASMAHSPYHPSTGLQRSCLLTPTVWFRRRVPIDPIRSLRNPDHPGGNSGQSPAPAHPVCFVWPATQVRSTMVAIPVPCGATGQPV